MKFLKGMIIAAKVIGALTIIAMGIFVLYIAFIFLGILWTSCGPIPTILAAIYMISFVVFINDTKKS